MRTYKTEKVTNEEKYVESIICDICKKEYSMVKDKNGNYKDIMEVQEFHCINFQGGYGSIFGDGVNVQADICQHCLQEKLGQYLKRSATEECPWNG